MFVSFQQCNTLPQEPSTSVAINNTLILTTTTTSSNKNSPDYPNMEYPPIFEPETYSLADPNASMTLLKRRNQNK
jgi:connector enhancer of kinase suppressor of Ras 2